MKTRSSFLPGKKGLKNSLIAFGLASGSLFFQPLCAQDIHFSQITEAPLFLNPANTGLFEGYMRATLNYRSQWSAMVNPYKTMAATVDGVIGEKKTRAAYMGWGVGFFNDQAGASAYAINQAIMSVSGIVHLNEQNKVCVGAGGGYAMRSANYGSLTFGNQYNGTSFDPNTPSFETLEFNKFNYVDVNAGLQWEFTKTAKGFDRDDNMDFKVGLAGYHLNQPLLKYYKYSKEKLATRWVGEISGRIDIKGTKLTILPSMIYMRQGVSSELNLGTFLRLRFKNPTKTTGFKHEAGVSIGGYIRPGDAMIPQILIDYASFSFGFAYDYNISSFKTATRGNGGIEFSLQWHSLRDALFKRKRELGGGGHGGPKATP
jgi:type IX secretion system PorP/SprF family membrane protein